ncbi:DNA-directed RNA polymerase sigma subunit RpoE [Neisseria wadsworthii 9715]|uniref:DNA-directed RNA polymerase sigma subunit RpoE n=1 Tax=Neisseria wadsworthii 9715 TaxID=1030841 RepID=G4CMT5_9NEIS|nr:DNA-directed RNA polymerase sigma subunit RpoE [Neisseria wadsworthii 9715]
MREIVALRDERGSYNWQSKQWKQWLIVALRDERGSYNYKQKLQHRYQNCSTTR